MPNWFSDSWFNGWWYNSTSTATSNNTWTAINLPESQFFDLEDLIEPEEEECKRGFFED